MQPQQQVKLARCTSTAVIGSSCKEGVRFKLPLYKTNNIRTSICTCVLILCRCACDKTSPSTTLGTRIRFAKFSNALQCRHAGSTRGPKASSRSIGVQNAAWLPFSCSTSDYSRPNSSKFRKAQRRSQRTMQYREVAWAQQLYFQRLLHGPAAEVTERRCVLCCCFLRIQRLLGPCMSYHLGHLCCAHAASIT
jgi:hypothetical protein